MTAALWFRVYAFLTFPYSREGSYVWWYGMHRNTHRDNALWSEDRDRPVEGCPFCEGDRT